MTASKADLQALLERVEKAEGPDREIDAEFALLAGWRHVMEPVSRVRDMTSGEVKPGTISCWYDPDGIEKYVPRFTASLDAAIGLVEKMLPGRNVNLEIGNVGANRVTDAYISGADGYFEEPKTPDAHGYGLTPALALCAALLSAKLQHGGGE